MGADPEVLRKAIDVGIRDCIADLVSSQGSDRSLLQVDRLKITIFDDFHGLMKGVIEAAQDDLLRDTHAMQEIFGQLDRSEKFQLSKSITKGGQQAWARAEGDKMRVLWAYFVRNASRHAWSHSMKLNQLKQLYAHRAGQDDESMLDLPTPPCSPLGASELEDLPSPPDSLPPSNDDIELEPISHMLPSPPAPAAALHEICSSTDQDEDAPARPEGMDLVRSMLEAELETTQPVDHVKHKADMRRMLKRPAGMKRPAAALASDSSAVPGGDVGALPGEGACMKRPAAALVGALPGEAEMLRNAAYHCEDVADERSDVQCTIRKMLQRGLHIWQLRDETIDRAIIQVNHKQARNHEHAWMAIRTLKALRDNGATVADLQRVKNHALGLHIARSPGC